MTTCPRRIMDLFGEKLVAFQGGILGIILPHYLVDERIRLARVEIVVLSLENGLRLLILNCPHNHVVSVCCGIDQVVGTPISLFEGKPHIFGKLRRHVGSSGLRIGFL
jgi:hypothetical protein